jgi:hypothetical protein
MIRKSGHRRGYLSARDGLLGDAASALGDDGLTHVFGVIGRIGHDDLGG